MAEHLLKTWPEPFQAIFLGRKAFEYRRDDRGFQVEDILRLEEWDPKTHEYTGRWLKATVLYIARYPAFGVPEGYCVMSLAVLP